MTEVDLPKVQYFRKPTKDSRDVTHPPVLETALLDAGPRFGRAKGSIFHSSFAFSVLGIEED